MAPGRTGSVAAATSPRWTQTGRGAEALRHRSRGRPLRQRNHAGQLSEQADKGILGYTVQIRQFTDFYGSRIYIE